MRGRYFLAVPVPGSITDSLVQYADAFPDMPISWVNYESYHITVTFFGEQEESFIKVISSTVHDIVGNTEPFSLRFEAISYAPPLRTPSMIWAQYSRQESFSNLVHTIEKTVHQLLPFTDKREGHQPIPHITMGRFKTLPVDPLPQITLDPIRVHEICLFRSEKTSDGRKYTQLQSFPLSNT